VIFQSGIADVTSKQWWHFFYVLCPSLIRWVSLIHTQNFQIYRFWHSTNS